jgi:hypothetical protein
MDGSTPRAPRIPERGEEEDQMKLSRWGLAVLAVWVAGCAAEPSRPVHGNEKPQAPVSLKVDQVDQGGGRYAITVVATPTDDLKSAQLRLILPAGVTSLDDDKPMAIGATPKGHGLTLTRHVQLDGVAGADVVADVRVDDGATRRNRAQIIRIGAARPAEAPRPVTTVTLPNGDKIEEVRQ